MVWFIYERIAHSTVRPLIGPLLLAADAISAAAIPLILGRLFLGRGWAQAALAASFFLTAFAGSGYFTLMVVNNGTPLYALIAAALIPAVRRDRWGWFHLAVALATAFKPYYAAFWIVAVLADGLRGRSWARRWAGSAAGFAVAVATYAAPAVLAPKLTAEWLHALMRETVGVGLLGDNLLGAMIKAHHGRLEAYAAQLGLSALLGGAALSLGRLDRRQRIAALVVIAVFVNPRAMRYDFSTAAVPLLALAAGAVACARAGALAQSLTAIVLAAVMIIWSRSTPIDGFLYAGLVLVTLLSAVGAAWARPAQRSAAAV